SVSHFEHVRDNLKAIVYHDQTNVGIEQQAIEISKNQIQHNIANIDTPGYRTRDLDGRMFESQLKDAIRSRDRSHGAESSLGAAPSVSHFEHVRDNLKAIVYHDQTNVGIEQQAIEISKNQIQHNIATTILASQFQLLGAAVSERA
ncbi:MAG TPA: hypothetical protein VG433_01530, partial [Pirellulales bacterium]|nr:hypothetical protein [Pirellulales bacterium]